MDVNLISALIVTTVAGASLMIGGLVALKIKKNIFQHILSFSGGIMLYVAFFVFMPSAYRGLLKGFSEYHSMLYANISFFVGLLATIPVDLILSYYNKRIKKKSAVSVFVNKDHEKELFLLIFLSITIHNFFEGIATFLSFYHNAYIAVFLILSIIAHNLPEGAVIASSIYQKTNNKKKAIWYCFFSGIAEPIGAIVAYFVIVSYFTPHTYALITAFLAGLLVNTSLNELLPGAYIKGDYKFSMNGIIAGMLFIFILTAVGYDYLNH